MNQIRFAFLVLLVVVVVVVVVDDVGENSKLVAVKNR